MLSHRKEKYTDASVAQNEKRKKNAIGRIGGSNLSVTIVTKSKLNAGKRNYLGYAMV